MFQFHLERCNNLKYFLSQWLGTKNPQIKLAYSIRQCSRNVQLLISTFSFQKTLIWIIVCFALFFFVVKLSHHFSCPALRDRNWALLCCFWRGPFRLQLLSKGYCIRLCDLCGHKLRFS